jgi:hypothetical protein
MEDIPHGSPLFRLVVSLLFFSCASVVRLEINRLFVSDPPSLFAAEGFGRSDITGLLEDRNRYDYKLFDRKESFEIFRT